jgi:membrane-bound metal-dependent hydrolase YbcI (DUF457 family)
MRREWHLAIGGIAFLFYQYFIEIINKTTNYPWLSGLFVASLGSAVPDIVEPASGWNHRGFCHGKGTLNLMLLLFSLSAFIALISSPFPNLIFMYLASCFFLGYVFHLLADSLTPMGLPK